MTLVGSRPWMEIADGPFRQALHLVDAGDADGLRTHLMTYPHLVRERLSLEGRNYFRNPSLLEFTAENPIRNGSLPANIADIANVIIGAGADKHAIDETLGLVCSGRVPRECGVQAPLIELLCASGASPDFAMQPALVHGEFDAVRVLLRLGSLMTLPVAAALGDTQHARRLLSASGKHDRHLALALAAQFGRAAIVRLLLETGEDPNRYNPAGAHAHSTPLHQAALAGDMDVVRLLLEHGASLAAEDTLYRGTPAGWARHAGNRQIEEYLVNCDSDRRSN